MYVVIADESMTKQFVQLLKLMLYHLSFVLYAYVTDDISFFCFDTNRSFTQLYCETLYFTTRPAFNNVKP